MWEGLERRLDRLNKLLLKFFGFFLFRYDFTWREIRTNMFRQYINPLHVIQSALHVVQVGMGYLLMLVAMTFNGWLFLAVCFGAGLGYLIFGRCRQSFGRASISSREANEHCH